MVVNKKIFNLESNYKPMGDQPTAISELVTGIQDGRRSQVLLGVTGSGKTFTMANVIAELGRPALIMAPNKILAAQLYTEMKSFFPNNHVEYFVSYYDYYQPEALTNNWIACGTVQPAQCWKNVMLLLCRLCRQFMVWARQSNMRV